MNRKKYLSELTKLSREGLALMIKKNEDYATSDDPFMNFRLCETVGVCSLPKGILVRIGDKFARICNLTNKDSVSVSDESIVDTLLDMANYCLILAVYLKNK